MRIDAWPHDCISLYKGGSRILALRQNMSRARLEMVEGRAA